MSKHLKLLKVSKVYFTKAELETTDVSYRKIENKNRMPYAEIKALNRVLSGVAMVNQQRNL